jgi:uncharacterized membrane protein SirB2
LTAVNTETAMAGSLAIGMSAVAMLAVKSVHVGCAALSLAGFAARGILMLRESPLLATRFARIAPHVVDTVLLASAVWLSWQLQQFPFVHGWVTAKVLALAAYIVLGSVALRRGPTRRARAVAFALALACAGYIVAVALSRDALGPLAWFAARGG